MSAAREPVRVGIAGIGYWGINLVRTFANEAGARVTWLCDPDPAAQARAAKLAPEAKPSADFDRLLAADDVDAVVIATPAVTHAELAQRALDAGKHVFVEKPLALSERDAEAVAAAVERSQRTLMVGHLMVYHPALEHLAALIARGELGALRYLYSNRVNLGRARRDENALWSFGPHDLSMIDRLLGVAPIKVWATGESYLRPGVEDVVFLHLAYPDQRLAHVHLSWLDPRKERRLTVVGSRKMAIFDDVASEKLRIYDKGYEEPPSFTEFGEYLAIRSGGVYIPHIAMAEPLARECQHFLDCVVTGDEPRSGIHSAMRVVRVLDAAQRSLDGGGVPVALAGEAGA